MCWRHRRWTVLLATRLIIETSYRTHVCTRVPGKCTWNIRSTWPVNPFCPTPTSPALFKVKRLQLFILYVSQVSCTTALQMQCTILACHPGTHLRTHSTLVSVSFEVRHHIMVMESGALYISHRSDSDPVLPHRVGTNFTPWCGENVTYRNTAERFHPFCSDYCQDQESKPVRLRNYLLEPHEQHAINGSQF